MSAVHSAVGKDRQLLLSRRMYLIGKLSLAGVGFFLANEAISARAAANPDWDMNELKTWDEWERDGNVRA